MGTWKPERRIGRRPAGDRRPEATAADRRGPARHRTRLRSGKIVSVEGNFVTECHFHDLADGGARIRPVGATAIPDRLWLFDDGERSVTYAEVIWRNALGIGISFNDRPRGIGLEAQRIAHLARKYYSL